MQTFDVLTLSAFVKENKNFIENSVINKIQQPNRKEFLFTLRNAGIVKKLYININPQFYHICFTSSDNYENKFLEIPQKPPMFCMLLRKYLSNSKIEKVNQPQNERILEFYISSYNELGEKIYLCLAIELMGKHSNVILYNYDTNIIIGCAHNVGSEKSREREIYGSLPYVYPPIQHKSDILSYTGEINHNTLSNDFYMISNNFALDCKNCSLKKIKSFVNLENLTPAISKDFEKYTLFQELLPNSTSYLSVNDMIDDYYSYYIGKYKLENIKSKYKTICKTQITKISKTFKQLEYKSTKDFDYDKYRLYGDLIMANLYSCKDFTSQICVYDYENDKQISIDLDETKSLKDNANKFYKQYNKVKTSQQKTEELISSYKEKLDYYKQIAFSLELANSFDEVEEISSELCEENKTKKKANTNIFTITVDNNTRIYIGKNNKQNDYIISKIATDEDLWFHVHNNAGSHVLLKSNSITDDLIYKCATLAKEYSTVKDENKVGVIYTKRKYIRKPPSANLGYVTYKNEQEIIC